jgi:hypothetical protein
LVFAAYPYRLSATEGSTLVLDAPSPNGFVSYRPSSAPSLPLNSVVEPSVSVL